MSSSDKQEVPKSGETTGENASGSQPVSHDHVAININNETGTTTSSSISSDVQLAKNTQQNRRRNRGVYDAPASLSAVMHGNANNINNNHDDHPLKRSTTTANSPSTPIKNRVSLNAATNEKDRSEAKKRTTFFLKKHSRSFHRYDDGLLHRAIQDAGRWAYGTVLVELWALNDERTLLFRPEGGYWIDPVFHQQSCRINDCPLCRLTDSDRDDYVPPEPLCPGEGLPGVLWTETSNHHRRISSNFFGVPSNLGSNLGSNLSHSRRSGRLKPSQIFSDVPGPAVSNRMVVWREIKAIANDPDQPWNPRLQVLADVGLGWVGAVDFSFNGHSGIVIYMARDGIDFHRLQSGSNEKYLHAASDLAGAAFALRGPRREVVDQRRNELEDVKIRVRKKILALVRMNVCLKQYVDENAAATQMPEQKPIEVESKCQEFYRDTRDRVQRTIRKSRGGGVHPPPSMSWKQSMLTFVGVFSSLLIITRLNVHVIENYGVDYAILLAPFGALMTLLYGLTAAPASQPRNAILGQTISLVIAICIGYADALTIWMKQSLATALAITAMVKLGLTHPPAGAAALAFSTGKLGWGNLIFLLIGNIIALGTATLINNWSDKRQYPSYWGLPLIEHIVLRMKKAEGEQAKHENH